MSKNEKDINLKINQVIGYLVATYDITPADVQSATAIDYLCIYEYEYDGKKYKYRTHQRDNFSPIPETIELSFTKDPSKAYKMNDSSKNSNIKSSSGIDFLTLVWIGLLIVAILILYGIYNIVKTLLDFEINIPFLLIFICLYILMNRKIFRKQKVAKNIDAIIEDAMLNNRTATAYLIKSRHRRYSNKSNSRQMRKYYKQYPYSGKYTYDYNGKKYNKTFDFLSTPPKSIRVFFGKNPKDIIHFTINK